jgi:hypothetical protein
MRACLQELRKRLEENHGKYTESLTKKAAASTQAAGAVSAQTPNVMQVMMLFQQVQHRAKAAQDRAKAGKGKSLATVAKTLTLANSCVWGCVQARTQWSTEEDTHRRPDITGCVSLVIQVMTQVVRRSSISRIGSGRITGEKWTPDVDTSRSPVAMMMNSIELCAVGYKLKEVIPPELEAVVRGGFRTRGEGL